jgi:TatD DNase family protein
MQLFDTHTHINFKAFRKDGKQIIEKTLAENTWLINVGSELRTSQRAIDYAQKFKKGVWSAVGLHPIHLFASQNCLAEEMKVEKFDYQKYLALAQRDEVVAIGEVGLDYHHFLDGDDIISIKKLQKEVFKKFIELSQAVHKPLIVHCWDAYDDLLEILLEKFLVNSTKNIQIIINSKSEIDWEKVAKMTRKENVLKNPGVIHSFIGSWKTAQKFLALDFKLGINGIATYSSSYDKLIKNCPLENLLIETDAPYLTPHPLDRKSRNESINVKYIAEKIAEVKGISINEVAQQTTKNAREVFAV